MSIAEADKVLKMAELERMSKVFGNEVLKKAGLTFFSA